MGIVVAWTWSLFAWNLLSHPTDPSFSIYTIWINHFCYRFPERESIQTHKVLTLLHSLSWEYIRTPINPVIIVKCGCSSGTSSAFEPVIPFSVQLSVWKSGPVRFFVYFWKYRDWDWSINIPEPQKTRLDCCRPVFFGLDQSQSKPV